MGSAKLSLFAGLVNLGGETQNLKNSNRMKNMNIITEIRNGVAKVLVNNNRNIEALAEVDENHNKVGDEVHGHHCVFNGGDARYDELYEQFAQ